jgi:hypothetical protein
LPRDRGTVDAVLAVAKRTGRVLTEAEVEELVRAAAGAR